MPLGTRAVPRGSGDGARLTENQKRHARSLWRPVLGGARAVFYCFSGMPAASFRSPIADPLDTVQRAWSAAGQGLLTSRDRGSLRTDPGQSQSGNSSLSPQACRVGPRPPNWPYGRLDRSPLSVPLETTLGAPRGGAKTTCERWQDRSVALEDRNPVADNPPYNKHVMKFVIYNYKQPTRTALTILLVARALEPSPDPGPQFQMGFSIPSCGRLTQPRHCPVAVVPDPLQEPGRRIGPRGDATRAPT